MKSCRPERKAFSSSRVKMLCWDIWVAKRVRGRSCTMIGTLRVILTLRNCAKRCQRVNYQNCGFLKKAPTIRSTKFPYWAVAYLTHRGLNPCPIFLHPSDCELFNLFIYPHYVIPNHYHLLLCTLKGNLVYFMRHTNSVSMQRHNRK